MPQSKKVGVRLPQETWDWLAAEAELSGSSASALLREAVGLLKADRKIRDQVRASLVAKGISLDKATVSTN